MGEGWAARRASVIESFWTWGAIMCWKILEEEIFPVCMGSSECSVVHVVFTVYLMASGVRRNIPTLLLQSILIRYTVHVFLIYNVGWVGIAC